MEVIINSNGILLTEKWQRNLIESGLDHYRCSIDGASDETFARLRGVALLPRLKKGLEGLVGTKERLGSATPRISIWCVATRENLPELPDLVMLDFRNYFVDKNPVFIPAEYANLRSQARRPGLPMSRS